MNQSLINKLLLGLLFITFFSCEEIIIEKDITNSEVILVAPAQNAQFNSTGVTFTWEPVADATEYQLQIATPNFTEPLQIVLDTIIKKNNFTQQLLIGSYEWRVKAVNSVYSTKYSSRLVYILGDTDFQNNTVVLNTPINNLITKKSLQNLSWGPIIGATQYQVQVYDKSNTVISDEMVTATNLDYIFTEGSFSWKVRASNGTQQTLYSSRSILVDKTVPNTPVLSSPADKSIAIDTNVSFQWNRTAIEGSVEKDSIFIYNDILLTDSKLKKEASSPFVTTLTAGTYYWYAKSFDAAGNSGEKSSVFSLTVN